MPHISIGFQTFCEIFIGFSVVCKNRALTLQFVSIYWMHACFLRQDHQSYAVRELILLISQKSY